MAYESTATITPELAKEPLQEHQGHMILRNPDGSITVQGPDVVRARVPQTGEFDENLAEHMNDAELNLLASRLCEFAEVDKTSRKDWEDRESRALDMMGLKDQPQEESDKGDDDGDGHNVTHPMLIEASVRFQANAIVEVFPANGPAETKVLGEKTAQKTARAGQIRRFMNHYLTEIDEGYFEDTDKMLMYLPMGGSAFRRAGQDFTTGLPTLRHVKATNFIAPYAGTDLASMPRYAWKFTMTGEDIDAAMQIGMFSQIRLPTPTPGDAQHAPAADRSDDRIPTMHDRDRIYDMLEYHVDLILEPDRLGAGAKRLAQSDVGRRPYVVVVDATNEKVLMVRRNWKKKDKKFKKRIWFAHHRFLPGLGFYGWGYPHVIGSLGNAASGAVNALLDSALAANFQGGFVTKESRISGQFRMQHGVWQQVESSAEDLAKSFYTPPFKEPSPALFQLLGALVNSGERFAGITDAAVGEGNNNGPVGTTVALIEQSQKPINAIHKRLHVSMSRELKMLGELIEEFIPDNYRYAIGDENFVLTKADFAPGVGIISVTDPSISSDTQRIARAQAVMQLQKENPTLYPPAHQAEAHRRMLIALKVPDIESVGPVVKTPQYLDPVAENTNIFAGNPVRVFPTQDDAAHLAIHQDGLQRAQALFPPEVFEKMIMPAMQAHIRDHMAKSYMKAMMNAAGIPPNFDADGNPAGLSPQIENSITARVVQVISKLPHPQPKPGTPNAEQMAQQQALQQKQAQAEALQNQQDQSFQADERRKQIAFENEERRKDQALVFQEGRVTAAAQNAANAKVTAATAQNVAAEGQHMQKLQHAADQHAAGLQQGAEAHKAAMDAAAAENGAEPASSSGAPDEAGIQAGDKIAQAAAGMEANADAHTGVS